MGGLLTVRRCLLLFAKEPLPGKVKTRLARDIGATRAAALYEAMLRDTLERSRRVSASPVLAYSPVGGTAYFAQLAPEATLLLQPDGDLGVRLQAAFTAAFELGFEHVAAVGSDAPHVPAAWIEEAFERLAREHGVIGPATDGGYWLIGLSRPAPGLFERVRWSSAATRADTEARAVECGVELAVLRETFDVDTSGELEHLREHVGAHPEHCSYTRAWFARTDGV